MFQFTRPRRARPSPPRPCRSSPLVSIHAPAKGATRCWRAFRGRPSCFNSRAREGRDFVGLFEDRVYCFQFTRPRRARPAFLRDEAPAVRFNSRAREGRDLLSDVASSISRLVSIHAPAKGATQSTQGKDPRKEFQFTRPRRARPSARPSEPPLGGFQFTRPRRARRKRGNNAVARKLFQFTRPRRARRLRERFVLVLRVVSIHAPAKGATKVAELATWDEEFQFTRPRRARRNTISKVCFIIKFQFTRPRRARLAAVS